MPERQFKHLLDPRPARVAPGMTRAAMPPAATRKTFGRFSETVDRHSDETLAALHAHHARRSKRAFDIVVAAVLLVILAPLMLIVAAAIRLGGRGPILFRHCRTGRDGIMFECLKFRTMNTGSSFGLHAILRDDPAASAQWRAGRKLLHDPRITPVGRVLRPLGLDELPQLFNVLSGEMSLVGPRPATADEVHHFGPARKFYVLARPGITGAWQVGRGDDPTLARRARMDVEYVQNSSMMRDLQLLAATPLALIRHRNS